MPLGRDMQEKEFAKNHLINKNWYGKKNFVSASREQGLVVAFKHFFKSWMYCVQRYDRAKSAIKFTN